MSTTYSLQARPGVAAQQGTVQAPKKIAEVLGSQIQPSADLHTTLVANAKDTPCSYSDVVASRPPSPISGTEGDALSSDAEAFACPAKVEETLVNITEVVSANNTKNIVTNSDNHESNTSSLSDLSNADKIENPWTTVVSRRSRSLDSLKRNAKPNKKVKVVQNRVNTLTMEQDTVVNQAEKQLTLAQKEQLSCRYEKVQNKAVPRKRSDSRGEGPSATKGKGVNPWNWGDAQLSDSDLDVEAQCAALESFGKKHGKTLEHANSDEEGPNEIRTPHQRDKTPSRNPSSKPFDCASIVPAARVDAKCKAQLVKAARTNVPINQITPKSYLGRALDNIEKSEKTSRCRRWRYSSNSDISRSDSSPSSSSSETSSDSEDEQSDSSIDSHRARKHPRHRSKQRHNCWRQSQSKKSKTLLKPIPPVEYDGAADARAYHRFVTEGTDYVTSGKVRKNRYAFVLSYYLKGKAYDFYTQSVSLNPHEWTLKEFFVQLFYYCFPSDYRSELREKLRKCFQNNKNVSEYAFELKELFNMIGVMDEREKTVKFWNGVRAPIQRQLWLFGLNPEVST